MSRIDYLGLAALDAVMESGSFEKAAAVLSVTQSAVSQRIRNLERSAGELLLVRSQPPRTTAAGQRFIAHYGKVRLLEAALAREAGTATAERARIVIAVNADSAATWLQQAVTPLMQTGDCMLHICIDDQDHTLSMLREGRVYGCVTSESALVAGTSATALGAMRYLCVASKAFAARWFPHGLRHEAIAQAPGLNFDRKDALLERFLRQCAGYRGRYPHHALSSSEGFVRFIEAGFGYGMLPLQQCDGALADGRLIDLMPGAHLDVPLVWHAWDLQTPFTRTLSDHIVDTARRALLQS